MTIAMDSRSSAAREDTLDPQIKSALDGLGSSLKDAIVGLKKRQDDFELEMQRPPAFGGESVSHEAKLQREAWVAFIKRGRDGLTAEHMNVLQVSDDSKGGYLAPAAFEAEVIKNITPYSPIRALVRPRKTVSGQVQIPARTGNMTGGWVGEIESRSETEPTYGLHELPISEMSFYCDASNWQLEDSAHDMFAELAADAAEEAGRLEGAAFVNGDSVKKPEGFLQRAGIPSTPTGNSTLISADSLITALYSLKPFYRARSTWTMNGSTLATVRKLKDGNGDYLWRPGLAEGQPETLLGRPVAESVDMPDISANSTPIVIADFESGYRIYDRLKLSMQVDPYSIARYGQTRFIFRRRVAGGVIKVEAFQKILVSAS